MRTGTWATVIAIVIIIALGWWAIDWTGEDAVPVTDTPTTMSPTTAKRLPEQQTPQQGQQQGEVAPPEQTVGEPAPHPEPRPID